MPTRLRFADLTPKQQAELAAIVESQDAWSLSQCLEQLSWAYEYAAEVNHPGPWRVNDLGEVLFLDEDGELHRTDGPARWDRFDEVVYALHGKLAFTNDRLLMSGMPIEESDVATLIRFDRMGEPDEVLLAIHDLRAAGVDVQDHHLDMLENLYRFGDDPGELLRAVCSADSDADRT